MNKPEKLEHILYISLPESFSRSIGSFEIDPSILLPVEIPRGMESEWTLADITWEMFVSAMMKILAWNSDHEHASYFRSFILALKPDIVSVMTGSAIEKAEKFEFDVAEEIFRALAEIDTMEEKTILNLAYLYEQRIDLYMHQENHGPVRNAVEEAQAAYQKALDRHPESPDVLFGAGYFFLMIGNPVQAGEHLSAFLKYAREEDNRREKVVKAVSEIERRSFLDSLFTRAYEAIRNSNEHEGIEKIELFLKERPDTWSAWFLLGWAHRRTGNFDKAREAFSSALDLETGEVDIYNEMAISLMELGEFEECRSMLDKALSIEPDNTKILSNRLILALKTGENTEARELLRIILEIDPDDPIALRYRDILTDI